MSRNRRADVGGKKKPFKPDDHIRPQVENVICCNTIQTATTDSTFALKP